MLEEKEDNDKERKRRQRMNGRKNSVRNRGVAEANSEKYLGGTGRRGRGE